MLPRSSRVPKKLFEEIMKRGTTIHAPCIYTKYIAEADSTIPRFSVVVSKKVGKTAVKRTLLRRKAYAALGAALTRFPIRNGSGIFFMKAGSERLNARELADQVSTMLQKLSYLVSKLKK